MEIDRYTKTVLTVICLCLVYLCLKSAFTIPKVHADAPLREVLVDGLDRPISGPIVRTKQGAAVSGFGSPLVVQVER